ncbi:TPA: DUF1372 family protein [Streptococcus suis]|nr:DUF1372 family protein [Streptococcus suis]
MCVLLTIFAGAIIGAAILLVVVFNENTALKKQLNELDKRSPVTLYTVDNAGGVMVGQITDKEIIEGRYTVTAEAYGKFLVTREQYEEVEIGQEMPEWLKGRGD